MMIIINCGYECKKKCTKTKKKPVMIRDSVIPGFLQSECPKLRLLEIYIFSTNHSKNSFDSWTGLVLFYNIRHGLILCRTF